MSTLKITASGQVSLPAHIRRRWNVSRVRMVDHGDHVTFEPVPDEPWEALRGRFAPTAAGPTADDLRRSDRDLDG